VTLSASEGEGGEICMRVRSNTGRGEACCLSVQANSVAVAGVRPETKGPWIYGPWLDLVVGCGAWSAPLLAIAMWTAPATSHFWIVGFYLLAIIFQLSALHGHGVPRVSHARDLRKIYKFFTLHLTLLLVLTGVLLHTSYRLFPWVFTLYICWSPVALHGTKLRIADDVRAAERSDGDNGRTAVDARGVCGVVFDAAGEF
jgi:hypothetical protein